MHCFPLCNFMLHRCLSLLPYVVLQSVPGLGQPAALLNLLQRSSLGLAGPFPACFLAFCLWAGRAELGCWPNQVVQTYANSLVVKKLSLFVQFWAFLEKV